MPHSHFATRLGLRFPIVQAPMIAPGVGWQLAAAVSEAGGLGSIGAAAMSVDQIRTAVAEIRAVTDRPFNLNFFCHPMPSPDPARAAAFKGRLAPYFEELGLSPEDDVPVATRAPFDAALADLMVELRPAVVSFHFGLPEDDLLSKVRASGAVLIASATTVAEARFLEARGIDAVIAQGVEAGGHRGLFLSDDITTQAGGLSLIPQIADAVTVPVIAAGGIADGRGIAAALILGANAVQIGTAYLLSDEAKIPAHHRAALIASTDNSTALTNLFTGRPARGIVNRLMREQGPIDPAAPAFPLAAPIVQPLRQAAEAKGSGDFSPLWSGMSAALARPMAAGRLTETLWQDCLDRLHPPV